MNMENLGYRFSRKEMETLRLILRLDVPLGVEFVRIDRATYDACVDDLCVEGFLIEAGESILVDPVVMLMLTQAACSDLCLRIRSEGRHTLVHRTEKLFILSDCTLTHCTLTPLQGLEDAVAAANGAILRHSGAMQIDLMDREIMETASAEYMGGAKAVLREMLNNFRTRCAE